MQLIKKIFGAKSKYDKSLPFTYYAVTYEDFGHKELEEHFFSDTICGLISYLNQKNIDPKTVSLYGAYTNGNDKPLSVDSCLDKDGKWLCLPKICGAMAASYKKTQNDCYRGHGGQGRCNFSDRNRAGSGPY